MNTNRTVKDTSSISKPRADALATELSSNRTRNRLAKLRELKKIMTRLAQLRDHAKQAFGRARGSLAKQKSVSMPTQPLAPGVQPLPPASTYRPVARPVSKLQIDQLHKQLSKPKPESTLTPTGPAMRQLRDEKDQAIRADVQAIRQRLATRRNALKEAMQRANDNKTMRRGPKR